MPVYVYVKLSVTNESEFGVKFQRQHANYGKVICYCSLKIEINVNFLEFVVITYQKTTSCFKFARKAQPISQMSFAFEAYSLNKAITFKTIKRKALLSYLHLSIDSKIICGENKNYVNKLVIVHLPHKMLFNFQSCFVKQKRKVSNLILQSEMGNPGGKLFDLPG